VEHIAGTDEMKTTISDLGDVITIADELFTRGASGEIWWRGHPDSTWGLVPGIFRAPWGHEREISANSLFQSRAETRHERCPRRDDDAGWLFFMQHHGLPTRLLDWTRAVLYGVYFAVRDDPKNKELDKKPATLWALNPFQLNEASLGAASVVDAVEPAIAPLFGAAFRQVSTSVEKIVAVVTREIDPRMMVQLSVFTAHGIALPLDKLPDAKSFLMRFEIPADAKPKIKRQLWSLSIRESNLFPDADHLANEIVGYYGLRP
jgi:hypothetical protein